MKADHTNVAKLAAAKEAENWDFRAFLKAIHLSSEQLDEIVFSITKRVWAKIDCTKCGNCCMELRPAMTREEMQRLALRLGIDEADFVARYLIENDKDNAGECPWRVRGKPCPFLEGKKCSVYDDRPEQCRGYPYLYEPDFVLRTLGMLERTFTCPIVYQVMEELKPAVGFRRRRRR